jgi:hypothetical protein
MSKHKCPNCGKRVATEILSCPRCGRSIPVAPKVLVDEDMGYLPPHGPAEEVVEGSDTEYDYYTEDDEVDDPDLLEWAEKYVKELPDVTYGRRLQVSDQEQQWVGKEPGHRYRYEAPAEIAANQAEDSDDESEDSEEPDLIGGECPACGRQAQPAWTKCPWCGTVFPRRDSAG